jgi:transcriptional regulator with XRE-family HTH domain
LCGNDLCRSHVNVAAMTRSQRHHLARQATEIRHRCLRDGLAPEAIAEVICREIPQMFALEAWRLAHGWSRTEVSARLDALYEADGLAAPRISSAELCRWEHGQRRPSDERIEYLCRLYATRPDRLGFGMDYSNAEVGHLARAGIQRLVKAGDNEAIGEALAAEGNESRVLVTSLREVL